MKRRIFKIIALVLILGAIDQLAYAQNSGHDDNVLNNGLLVIGALVVLAAIVLLSENLLKVEAKRNNLRTDGQDTSIFPGVRRFFEPNPPTYVKDGDSFTYLKKGFDILLEGKPANEVEDVHASTYAIQPPNYRGIAPIPKLKVEVGDEVKAGDPVFFDKKSPDINYVAPVSGEVIAVNRGAKRAITEIVILADKETKYRNLNTPDLKEASREEIVKFLMDAGFWPNINQRPFDIVPDPEAVPRDVFISTFDTSPLGPDLNIVVDGESAVFQTGLNVLSKLTSGHVHLGLDANSKTPPNSAFTGAEGVKKHWFKGKHPAGNVGVQIHHVSPLNPGESVWTLGVNEVILLGRIFLNGEYNTQRVVALSGTGFTAPMHVRTYAGAKIGELVKGHLVEEENLRLISGNVLTGEKKSEDGFLNMQDNLISTAPEGNYNEMFGWLIPSSARPSISKTFPNFIFPSAEYEYDTNLHGERRAFVMTGQYESVLPMEIYPQHLMKAIMAQDFERMEGLGILELSEEDIALCEFACTSKMPLQEILREGLDLMREQG